MCVRWRLNAFITPVRIHKLNSKLHLTFVHKQDFYETTLDALKDAKNERLWFKTMTKLGKLYFDREDYGKLSRILKQLHSSCTTQEGK